MQVTGRSENPLTSASATEEPASTRQEGVQDDDRSPFLEGLRRMVMAGIGAMIVAQEGIEGLVAKVDEQGAIAKRDSRRLVEGVRAKGDRVSRGTRGATGQVEASVENTREYLNVPSQEEITQLSRQIEELSRKVDALTEEGRSQIGPSEEAQRDQGDDTRPDGVTGI